MSLNLATIPRESARRNPSGAAIVAEDFSLTHRDLDDRARRPRLASPVPQLRADGRHELDTPGEICIKGYNVMKGYYKRPEAIIAYCHERLAPHKCPRLVEFREALPKGPTGKILKRALRG